MEQILFPNSKSTNFGVHRRLSRVCSTHLQPGSRNNIKWVGFPASYQNYSKRLFHNLLILWCQYYSSILLWICNQADQVESLVNSVFEGKLIQYQMFRLFMAWTNCIEWMEYLILVQCVKIKNMNNKFALLWGEAQLCLLYVCL